MPLQALRQAFGRAVTALEQHIKRLLQPVKPYVMLGTLADITRSKSDLIMQNAFLRQELVVLHARQSVQSSPPLIAVARVARKPFTGVEKSAVDRQTRYALGLASAGLSIVLAVQVQSNHASASGSSRGYFLDTHHGTR